MSEPAGIGHNRLGAAAEELVRYVERIERLEEEEDALKEDKKSVYGEAKTTGFDVKIIRLLVRRRRMESAAREEQDALLELYEGFFA